MEKLHIPVLLSEVLAILDPHPGDKYLDLTAGYGGHAREILDVTRQFKDSCLVDRDEFAVNYLKNEFPSELEIKHTNFYDAVLQLIECGKTFDIILADFGVSSPQLDMGERGFSFKNNGPLDMRMDGRQKLTAADIVNGYSERELADLFINYGEIPAGRAAMFARIIMHHRPFKSTQELAELISARWHGYSKTHPATKIFQAIRIEVNDELGEIKRTLPLLPKVLNRGGRVGIITFHSLEDRLVKEYFKEAASKGEESELSIINKKPIIATNTELDINPRARSAKLRAAIRD
ncbi:16S rRNA (cytosine(1402)-N(4))-methyltransferase RsmH [Candidatus Saccharibacteria bacterium]|nr:16S rRNA (cytosine(1402)-N(4))-methyltransferase RsmH [Candidatus Saccharibacteria bacterium]